MAMMHTFKKYSNYNIKESITSNDSNEDLIKTFQYRDKPNDKNHKKVERTSIITKIKNKIRPTKSNFTYQIRVSGQLNDTNKDELASNLQGIIDNVKQNSNIKLNMKIREQ